MYLGMYASNISKSVQYREILPLLVLVKRMVFKTDCNWEWGGVRWRGDESTSVT